MKAHQKFQNSIHSYLLVFIIGIISGILTRLTDFFPADTLWSLGSVATLFGYWIVTVVLVIYFSSSNLNAAINAGMYLLAMSFSFYFMQYILGLFLPEFDNGGFKYSLFGLYAILSLVCGIISYVLYFWNKKNRWNSVLYALPAGGLAAETIGVGLYLLRNHTFLFQFLFDLFSLVFIGIWFYKKAFCKWMYILTALITSFLGYLLFYKPFL